MASNAPANIGGYDCKFVHAPSSDLKCLICLCVAKDPLQHGEGGCGKIYCRSCITEYRKGNNKCPNCRGNIFTFKDVRSKSTKWHLEGGEYSNLYVQTHCLQSRAFGHTSVTYRSVLRRQISLNYCIQNIFHSGERDIQSLKVKCENLDYGCKWVDELRSLENHLQNCDYILLQCPNECMSVTFQLNASPPPETKRIETKKTIYRKDLQKHLKECPRRPHTCPHCMETGEYQDIIGKHTRNCPKIEITCSNAPQCQLHIPRENLQSHLSTNCLYEKVSCKYRGFGCEVEPLRKDLEDHEKDDKLHLHITMETVLTLKNKCDMLTPHLYVPQKIVLVFKVVEFALSKRENSTFYSPPFFTHPGGYKMIINVDANGYDDCEGTHVSVWAYLMKGKYDDQLEFPFLGTVTFELLNQMVDKIHHKRSYRYKGSDDSNQRVILGDMALEAQGIHAFIRHTDLEHNVANNCCYLKDDCLVFRIYVEVPSYKPWLQCTV